MNISQTSLEWILCTLMIFLKRLFSGDSGSGGVFRIDDRHQLKKDVKYSCNCPNSIVQEGDWISVQNLIIPWEAPPSNSGCVQILAAVRYSRLVSARSVIMKTRWTFLRVKLDLEITISTCEPLGPWDPVTSSLLHSPHPTSFTLPPCSAKSSYQLLLPLSFNSSSFNLSYFLLSPIPSKHLLLTLSTSSYLLPKGLR